MKNKVSGLDKTVKLNPVLFNLTPSWHGKPGSSHKDVKVCTTADWFSASMQERRVINVESS